MKDQDQGFRGDVQVTKDGSSYFFLYGGKLITYDVQKEEIQCMFDTSSFQCVLNETDDRIYFSEGGALYAFDLQSKTKNVLVDGVHDLAVSRDEKKYHI